MFTVKLKTLIGKEYELSILPDMTGVDITKLAAQITDTCLDYTRVIIPQGKVPITLDYAFIPIHKWYDSDGKDVWYLALRFDGPSRKTFEERIVFALSRLSEENRRNWNIRKIKDSLDDMEKDAECPICFVDIKYERNIVNCCYKTICTSCCHNILKQENKCPFCREIHIKLLP